MRSFAIFIAVACAIGAEAFAQGSTIEKTCPVDGKRFQFQGPPPSISRELFLDMKPVEPGEASWPLPKCPDNGFVIYKSRFSESKLRKLRLFIAEEPYRSMVDTHSTHYLAAMLMKRVEEPPYDVAWSLVRATWETSNPAHFRQYAEEALAAYESLPPGAALPRRQRVLREMMSGELERRLGMFDAAKRRFSSIRDEAEFTTPVLQRVIQLQLKLIGDKDSGSYRMPN